MKEERERVEDRARQRERKREGEEGGGESGKRLSGDGGTSFDPVRSTRVLQVRRSLGPDQSLNTPRRTCRGIIHCLYFPLLPSSSPFCLPSLFFSHVLVSSPSFIPFLASRSRRALSDAFQTCHHLSRPSRSLFYYPL